MHTCMPFPKRVLPFFGVLIAAAVWPVASVAASPLGVRADFEGASVREVRVNTAESVIEFMPGGDPARGWPCWWFFRIEGMEPSQVITLRLRGSDAIVSGAAPSQRKPLSPVWAMPSQAAFSHDGKTWFQTDKGVREGECMIYRVRAEGASVWVAWGPPYTVQAAGGFVRGAGLGRPGIEARELCRSREGRSVPMLRVCEGPREAARRFGVWIQARQHAWESGSSWVAQGLAEWLLSDSADAEWLRQHAELFVVPVMDADNVATGNGGKDALPHDHNRDWSESPHWNETIAARRFVGDFISQNRMDVFLDLHNPSPGDPTFFYALETEMLPEPARDLRERFLQLGYSHISKGKPFIPISNRPKFTGPAYHPLWRNISANWVAMNANPHTVSLCLETGWNMPSGNTEGYKAVGSRLGAAVCEFLKERPARD